MVEDRLDRIEAAVEANTSEIAELRESIIELWLGAVATNATINALVQIVEIHQRHHEASQHNFEAMQ